LGFSSILLTDHLAQNYIIDGGTVSNRQRHNYDGLAPAGGGVNRKHVEPRIQTVLV